VSIAWWAGGLLIALRALLGLCLAAYCAYAFLGVWAARRWHRARRLLDPTWTPPVTILKPVRDVDAEAYENFASFCRLDYPADRYQLLFGALDPADPALDLARRLQAEFPHLDIGIIAGGPASRCGPNLKVCNLAAMLPAAKHELLALCDSDMRVRPDYLRRIVAPFQRGPNPPVCGPHPLPLSHAAGEGRGPHLRPLPQEEGRGEGEAGSPPSLQGKGAGGLGVGLVTCPYRGCRVGSFAAALEALGIGADFIPSALVSRALEGVAFAFGSTILLPRAILEELGGFDALRDELADDFRLGEGAKRAGYEVVLSDYVVDDVLGQERFGPMWARRLRWARTVRACRPAGYAGSFVTHGFALSSLFLCAAGFSPFGWAVWGGVLGVRLATALAISCLYTQDPNIARFLPLLPISDLLSFTLYLASFCGNQIVWRGERFRLLPGGKLTRLETPQAEAARQKEL